MRKRNRTIYEQFDSDLSDGQENAYISYRAQSLSRRRIAPLKQQSDSDLNSEATLVSRKSSKRQKQEVECQTVVKKGRKRNCHCRSRINKERKASKQRRLNLGIASPPSSSNTSSSPTPESSSLFGPIPENLPAEPPITTAQHFFPTTPTYQPAAIITPPTSPQPMVPPPDLTPPEPESITPLAQFAPLDPPEPQTEHFFPQSPVYVPTQQPPPEDLELVYEDFELSPYL